MKNVVFITVDSLRADYVFGSKAPDSLQTLPELASTGLKFTNAFSDVPYTKQSFRSILSGTYPWMFDQEQVDYDPDRPHIAELLSEAGYATDGFHTNTYLSPAYNYDRGFDHYMGRDAGNGTSGNTSTTYNSVVEKALTVGGVSDVIHWLYKTAGKHVGVQLGSSLYKPAGELNDAIERWMRECPQPVFLWAHYMDVHNPYYPHEGTVSEGISRRKAIQLFHRVNELRGDAPDEDIETLERLYQGELEYFDRELGDLLARIDESLSLDNTLVVFTSDHGEAFDEKGHVFHPGGALYDENIHIPTIVAGPGIEPGTVETPVSNVDLVPTMLAAVGVDQPASVVGDDLREFATDPPERRLVFTESFSREDGNAMVTDGRYKLIRNLGTGEQSLYDRDERPKEIHDRADDLPAVRDRLATALDEHIQSVKQTEGRSADVEVTEDVRLQLRKLGYDE